MWPKIYGYATSSRLRGKAKLGKQKRPKRGRNTNTYAFIIRVVQGADYQQSREVEALALYNKACNFNYVSARFARDYLAILESGTKDDIDRDCTLVWACEGLGRYEQRSVFWIAPHADFDILFGHEKDFNCISEEANQFNTGIESGILSQEIPKHKQRKTFQGGIDDEYLLPVERSTNNSNLTVADLTSADLNISDSIANKSTGVDLTRRSRMPSLAEIKRQLAKELNCSLERKLEHERRCALNTFDPHYMAGPRKELADGRTAPPVEVVRKLLKQQRGDAGDPTLRPDVTNLSDGSKFKGNKRAHSEELVPLPTDTNDSSLHSPKLRNVRPRSMAIHLPENSGISSINIQDKVSNDDVVAGLKNVLSESKSPEPKEPLGLENRDDPVEGDMHHSIVGASDEVLFSYMDGECPPSTIDMQRTSISISSQESTTADNGSVDTQLICDSTPRAMDNAGKREKRKREKDQGWTDKKFKEFWTNWDEGVGNWYHLDEVTKKRIWYEPPKPASQE